MNKKKNLEDMEHFVLFKMAAFQTLYSHLCAYFEVDDLFTQHRININAKLLNTHYQDINRGHDYDSICVQLNSVSGNGLMDYYHRNNMCDVICEMFESDLFNIMALPSTVIATFYMLNYYGNLEMRNSTYYLAENLRKTGCANIDHNSIYYHGYNAYKNHQWHDKYELFADNYSHVEIDVKIPQFLVRTVQLLANCISGRDVQCVENLQVDHLLLNTPDGSIVEKNSKFICYVNNNSSTSLYFNHNVHFVYVSNKMPDLHSIQQTNIQPMFNGVYAILWDGNQAKMVDQNNVKIFNVNINKIRIYEKKNYLIWIKSLSTISYADGLVKYKLLVPNDTHLEGIFDSMVIRIQQVMSTMDFDHLEGLNFGWLIENYSKPGLLGN